MNISDLKLFNLFKNFSYNKDSTWIYKGNDDLGHRRTEDRNLGQKNIIGIKPIHLEAVKEAV